DDVLRAGPRFRTFEASKDRGGERLEVIRLARRDEIAVLDDLPIDPARTRVLEVLPDGRPRGERLPADHVRLDQELRSVADGRDGLTGPPEAAHERHDAGVEAEMVWRVAARNDERVEVGRVRARRGDVDAHGRAPALPAERRAALLDTDDRHLVSRGAQPLA